MEIRAEDTPKPIHCQGYLYKTYLLHRKKVWCELREGYFFFFPDGKEASEEPEVRMLRGAVVWYQRSDSYFALETRNAWGKRHSDGFLANPITVMRWVENIQRAQQQLVSGLNTILTRKIAAQNEARAKAKFTEAPKTVRSKAILDRWKSFVHSTLSSGVTKALSSPSEGDSDALLHRLKTLSLINAKKPEEVTMDNFTVLELLGTGSHGSVYKVEHKQSKAKYALKIISKAHIRRPSSFFVELYVLRTLKHPFLVKLITAFETPAEVAILLNYLPNGTLKLKIGKGLPVDVARRYAAQMVLAISYLHDRGIVYRDVKPENIVFDEKGNCVLTDMSLARRNTLCFTICGTPLYVAPEVLLRDGYTKDVDWWSFGVMLYEMLYGVTPFVADKADTIFELILTKDVKFPANADVPESAKNIIQALLKKNPVNRLTSAKKIRRHAFFNSINWKALPKGLS